jgi:hypothetical protein
MFSSIVLPDDWERRVLAKLVHQDETARIISERERVKEKLRRLGQAFVDGLFDQNEYHRQKKAMEWELESLLIPEVDAAKEAGRLLQDLPRLWAGATLQERHQLLTTILDAVYIDLKDKKSIVSVKMKPVFQAVLGATSRAAVERLGFTLEAYLRDLDVIDNKRHDIAMYSILAREWHLPT